MPELPEIHIYAEQINGWSNGRTFTSIRRNASAKGPDLTPLVHSHFHIFATARGKELKLVLSSANGDGESVTVTFRHGLVGGWKWDKSHALPATSQIMFLTDNEMGLCFHDAQRMGRWSVGDFDFKDRSPDPLVDFKAFKEHVLSSVNSTVFKKPICEVMLEQKYFNGIGNYLRAEVLCRANVSPFRAARDVLSSVDGERVLSECHNVPNEVVSLRLFKYGDYEQQTKFNMWLKCYGKGLFKLDSKKRKIYYLQSQVDGKSAADAMAPSFDTSPAEDLVVPDNSKGSGDFEWNPVVPDRQGPKPLTHMLLAISVLGKKKLINYSVKSWLKEQALSNNEIVYCVLEAFLAEEEKDFEDLADSWERLYSQSHSC